MSALLRLHYAPDNASLCVRMALEALAIPFETALVDRRRTAQRDAAYLALNPNGLIPALETPQGALFETGAILNWLADTKPGTLLPAHDDPARGTALTWLYWLSNTLHPAFRMLFYPDVYFPADPDALRAQTRIRLRKMLTLLDAANPAFLSQPDATAQGCYLAPLLRWAALYGGDTTWFNLGDTPRLAQFAQQFETLPCAVTAMNDEGLGATPFTRPTHANPPEGTAT